MLVTLGAETPGRSLPDGGQQGVAKEEEGLQEVSEVKPTAGHLRPVDVADGAHLLQEAGAMAPVRQVGSGHIQEPTTEDPQSPAGGLIQATVPGRHGGVFPLKPPANAAQGPRTQGWSG